MATVRDGIYLEDNPPTRSQFRIGRRDPVRSVIVVHTAESGTDRSGPDPKAEGVASFIQRRTDPGSYHLIGDADSIIQLIRFDNEAFHDGTGSNRWSIGISLAMNAADWGTIPAARRAELIGTAGQMAAIAARWLQARGLQAPAARLLTKAESDRADATGFISHARRDPARRTDPGAGFPWAQFFHEYQQRIEGVTVTDPQQPDQLGPAARWQLRLVADGYAHHWRSGPHWSRGDLVTDDDHEEIDAYVDDEFGAQTLADSIAHANDRLDPTTAAKVGAADAIAAGYRALMEATS